MNTFTEQLICSRTVKLLLHVFANLTGNRAVKSLPLNIVLSDAADTASTGQSERGVITITMPRNFAGCVVADKLMLGLGAHELAHLPDLNLILHLLSEAKKERQGETLSSILNLVEDIRIEAPLRNTQVNDWLTAARQAAHNEQLAWLNSQEPTPPWNDLWNLLMLIRFSDPQKAMSSTIPHCWEDTDGEMHIQAIAYYITGALGSDNSPNGSLSAARNILDYATRIAHLSVPPPCPQWERLVPMPCASDPDGQCQDLRLPRERMEGLSAPVIRDKFDRAAYEQGARLAAEISQAWDNAPLGHVAIGVGRYNPRLEGSGLPPFTMSLSQRASLPRKLLLLVDISDSMWSNECDNLHMARVAATAITLAAQATGGEVVLVPFWMDYTIARSIEDMLHLKGEGTELTWLPKLASRYPEHRILIVTDADVVEPAWSEQDRRRTACIYIPLGGKKRKRMPTVIQKLAVRTMQMNSPDDLPYLVALAARSTLAARS